MHLQFCVVVAKSELHETFSEAFRSQKCPSVRYCSTVVPVPGGGGDGSDKVHPDLLVRILEKVFWMVFSLTFSASIQILILSKTLENAVKNLRGNGSDIVVVGTTGEIAHDNQMWSKYLLEDRQCKIS